MTNIKPIMLNSTGVDIKNNLSAVAAKLYDSSLELNSNKTQIIDNNPTSELYASSSALMTYIQKFYPVGKIYISTDSANPSTFFGFGTWELVQDRFLLGAGSSFVAGSTGGYKDAIVVSHSHSGATSTDGEHTHSYTRLDSSKPSGNDIGAGQYRNRVSGITGNAGSHTHTATINSTGEDGTNKNMPPYMAVYIWKRIA